MDFYHYIARKFVLPLYLDYIKSEMTCLLLKKGQKAETFLFSTLKANKSKAAIKSDNADSAESTGQADFSKLAQEQLSQKQKETFRGQQILAQTQRDNAYAELIKFLHIFDKADAIHRIDKRLCPFPTDIQKLKETCLTLIHHVQSEPTETSSQHHRYIHKINTYGLAFFGMQLDVDILHYTLRLENFFNMVQSQRIHIEENAKNGDFPSVSILQSLVLTFDEQTDMHKTGESSRQFLSLLMESLLKEWQKKYPTATTSLHKIEERGNLMVGLINCLVYPTFDTQKIIEKHDFFTRINQFSLDFIKRRECSLDVFEEILPEEKALTNAPPVLNTLIFDLVSVGQETGKDGTEADWLKSSGVLLLSYLYFLDFDTGYRKILQAAHQTRWGEFDLAITDTPYRFLTNYLCTKKVERRFQLSPLTFSPNLTEKEKAEKISAYKQQLTHEVIQPLVAPVPIFNLSDQLFFQQLIDFGALKTPLGQWFQMSGCLLKHSGFRSIIEHAVNRICSPEIPYSSFAQVLPSKTAVLPLNYFNVTRSRLLQLCALEFMARFNELNNALKTDIIESKLFERLSLKQGRRTSFYADPTVAVSESEQTQKIAKQILQQAVGKETQSLMHLIDATAPMHLKREAASTVSKVENHTNKPENTVTLTPVVLFGLRFRTKSYKTTIEEWSISLDETQTIYSELELFALVDFLQDADIEKIRQEGVTTDCLDSSCAAFSFHLPDEHNYNLLNEWSVIAPFLKSEVIRTFIYTQLNKIANTIEGCLNRKQAYEGRKQIVMLPARCEYLNWI